MSVHHIAMSNSSPIWWWKKHGPHIQMWISLEISLFRWCYEDGHNRICSQRAHGISWRHWSPWHHQYSKQRMMGWFHDRQFKAMEDHWEVWLISIISEEWKGYEAYIHVLLLYLFTLFFIIIIMFLQSPSITFTWCLDILMAVVLIILHLKVALSLRDCFVHMREH